MNLAYMLGKWGIEIGPSPIEIPNVNRIDLAKLFAELGFTVGVEVGVARGRYSKVLLENNPGLKLYGVDPWEAHEGYADFEDQNQLSDYHQTARETLAPYNFVEIQKYSMDAVNDFEDGSLDFVYIDANHVFPYIMDDICAWTPKVRPGGVVSGHDYRLEVWRPHKKKAWVSHVPYAVTAYTQAYHIEPWFLFGTKAKVEGQVRDDFRSWMWFREETWT